MSDIIAVEGDSVRLYQYNFDKPDLSDELLENNGIDNSISHYNHNHDPRNGQFTTGHGGSVSGGGGSKLSGRALRKKKKQLKKARKVRAANAKRRIKEQKIRKKEELSNEQLEKIKEKIKKNKDVKSMLKNADKFTTSEIYEVLNRIDAEKKLSDKVKDQSSIGKKIGNGIKDAAYDGAKKYGRDLVKSIAYNGLDIGVKKLAKEVVGEENKETLQIIAKLLRGV